MCFDNTLDGQHECIDPCPICYFFTPANTLSLLRGESIVLGDLELFSEVARVGCRMCAMLVKIWESDDETYSRNAQVRVFRPKDAPQGKIWTLYFEIETPGFEGSPWGPTEGGHYSEKQSSSWAVPIGVFTKGTKRIGCFPVEAPNPSVSHDEVFTELLECLATCLTTHETCCEPIALLPTRVLVLDDPDAPEQVFLYEPDLEERGHYAALSYCWGKTAQTKLLMSNIETLKNEGVPISTLPQTLQDALTVNRKIGIKYLWIDSLCIIQDSAADKEKEVAGMSGIYKNALFVISAAASSDCGSGFLQDRASVQVRLDASLRIPFFSTADPDTREIIDWIYLCPEGPMGYVVFWFFQEPVNRRAWTYQESKLAQRLLIFGHGPPQWRCKESWKICGLDINPKDLPHRNGFTRTLRSAFENSELVDSEVTHLKGEASAQDFGEWTEWLPLLENYSRKSLTIRTDKLLAISALAAEYESPQRGTYAAGLWQASFPRSLLWRRDSKAPNFAGRGPVIVMRTTRPEYEHSLSWLQTRLFDTSHPLGHEDGAATWENRYIAPTWSPMCCAEPIHFETAAALEDDEFHTSLVEVHDGHICLTSASNIYGRLDFAYLDLTAPMRRISWAELTADFIILRAGEPFDYCDYVVADDPEYFAYMAHKYGASIIPQMLADEVVQHTLDPGDFSAWIGKDSVRISTGIVKEPASLECADFHEAFVPVADVRHEVLGSILQAESTTDGDNLTPNDECELWLLEVERSTSPAGLVLKRVRDNIFARVAYFGMNRNLDPEIVYRRSDMVQIRGPKTSGFGKPAGMGAWYESLTRRRIYLV